MIGNEAIEIVQLELVVPVTSDEPTGYLPRHLNVRLNPKQLNMLGRLRQALQAGHYRRANGKHVDKLNHVVEWLFDQVAIQVEGVEPSDVSEQH
jgi:hypothetical protein